METTLDPDLWWDAQCPECATVTLAVQTDYGLQLMEHPGEYWGKLDKEDDDTVLCKNRTIIGRFESASAIAEADHSYAERSR